MSIVALADFVSDSHDIYSAIIGEDFLPGVGKVILFTDTEARDAWESHVRPLKDKGHVLALNSFGQQVSIVWGKR